MTKQKCLNFQNFLKIVLEHGPMRCNFAMQQRLGIHVRQHLNNTTSLLRMAFPDKLRRT